MIPLDQLDREIDTQRAELQSFSTMLVELESHDGLEHVRRYPPTGLTAQKWAPVETAIGQMWEELHRMTSILDAAQSIRTQAIGRDDPSAVAELRHLLHGRPLIVTAEGTCVTSATDPALSRAGEFVGLSDVALRLRTAFPAVTEFLCSVEAISNQVATCAGPVIHRLDQAGIAVPDDITDLLAVSASDPLSLTAQDIRRRIEHVAEDISLHVDWPQAHTATHRQLDELEVALKNAADTSARAQNRVVTSPPPKPDVDVAAFRRQLSALAEPDPTALRVLRTRIVDALRQARQSELLATGLLRRRTELKGRLSAYEAKAARLGIAEDPDVLASAGIAASLLARRPCDLRAATRAVADYQQLITAKRSTR